MGVSRLVSIIAGKKKYIDHQLQEEIDK